VEQHLQFKLLGGGEAGGDHDGVMGFAVKGLLPGAIDRIVQPLLWDAGVPGLLIQQEQHPGKAFRPGGIELQFGAGDFRSIPHR
jgi:hypothetical protein